MPIHYTLTDDDYVAAQRVWQSVRFKGRRVALVAVLALAFVLAWRFGPNDNGLHSGVAGGLAALVGVPLYSYWVMPKRMLKVFRQQKTASYPLRLTWSDEALSFASDIGDTRLPWSVFTAWVDAPTTLALLQSDIVFNPIPKRVLAPEDVRAIMAHLCAAGVPERRRFTVRW